MKRFLSGICVVIIMTFILCSCKSKEEKVIDHLNNLAEKVEKDSSGWDGDQWADALEELEKIHSDMSDCCFTSQQLQDLGEVEGKLMHVMITNGAESVGKGMNSFLEGAGSFVEGFQEGFREESE